MFELKILKVNDERESKYKLGRQYELEKMASNY